MSTLFNQNERPLRFWCQKVLPLVYNDSLSYYEVLCKVVDYINNLIEDYSEIPDYIISLIASTEIASVDKVSDMITLDLNPGGTVLTSGYNSVSDGGGLVYLIKETDDGNGILMDNGNYANPVFTTPYVTPEMFGGVGDEETDDGPAIAKALTVNRPLNLVNKYGVYGEVALPANKTVYSKNDGGIVKHGDGYNTIVANDNCKISGVSITGTRYQNQVKSTSNREIFIDDRENVSVENCTIVDVDYDAILIRNGRSITVEGCHIERYGYAAIMCMYECSDIKILNNTILNGTGVTYNNRYPICVGTGDIQDDTYKTRSVICDGNYIEDETPYWEGIDAHGIEGGIITNNIIVNTLAGIQLVEGNTIRSSQQCIISNNTYRRNIVGSGNKSSWGIALFKMSRCIVSGNVIDITEDNPDTTDKGGIKGSPNNSIISNNNISLPYTGAWRGMLISAYSDEPVENLIVSGNRIATDFYGFQPTNSSCRISITGYNNTFIDCAYGVYAVLQPDEGGANYRSPVYFRQSTFVNNTNNFYSNGRGGYADSYNTNPPTGRKGDIIFNSSYASGQPFAWLCTVGFGESNAATWLPLYSAT